MSEKLEGLLRREIDKIGDKGELNNQSLELVYKLTKSYYYLVAARTMEEGGYSEANRPMGYGYGYDNDGGYSGRRRRDSMGRYTRDGDNSYDRYGDSDSYSHRYYSSDYSSRGDMHSMLTNMMNNASDPKERETIQKLMNQMGR